MKLFKNGKSCNNDFSYNSKNNKDYLTVSDLKILIKKNQEDFEL